MLVCTAAPSYFLYLAIVITRTRRLTLDKSSYLGPALQKIFICWNGRDCLPLSCRERAEHLLCLHHTEQLWLSMLRWHLNEEYFKVNFFLLQCFQTGNNYLNFFLPFWSWNLSFKYHLPRTLYGEGNGNPLQYSCLENPMDGGAWQATVHGVAKSQTQLSDFTFAFHFHALEKEMATHSSVLAWRIPGTGCLVGCHPWGRTKSDTTEAT